jgi:hypothetical protein
MNKKDQSPVTIDELEKSHIASESSFRLVRNPSFSAHYEAIRFPPAYDMPGQAMNPAGMTTFFSIL